MKQSRLKKRAKRAKWVCTIAACFVAALAAFSACWGINYTAISADGEVIVFASVEAGLISVGKSWEFGHPEFAGGSGVRLLATREWNWGIAGEPHVASDWRAGLEYTWSPTQHFLGVSLVYPFLLLSIPAALLWYADRRRFGPGLCIKCGYDRSGIPADTKCPECGLNPSAPKPPAPCPP